MQSSREKENRWAGLREVMAMSGPIILGSLSFTLMRFVDQMVVSKLGTAPLAAMGSAGVWSYVMGCFIFGIVGCVSTFVSQCYGKGDTEQCARYTWQGIHLSALAAVIAVVFWPLSRALFDIMGHSAEVTGMEATFFRIWLFGYPAVAWMTAVASFFQSVGRPGIPMLASIAANVVNLVLNLGLVFGLMGLPRMGIAGSALATVIAQWFQALCLHAVFMSSPFNARFKSRHAYAPDLKRIRELFRIGFFSGLTILMDVMNWAIFTSFVVGYFGDIALAAHNAALGFMHLCFMPALGVNQGICAIVGQYIGRKDLDTAVARTYTGVKVAMIYMVCTGIVFAFFGKGLIQFFFSGDAGVIALGHKLLILAALFQAFDAVNIIILGALRGAGDTLGVAVIIFVFAYFFFLPLSMALAFLAGWGTIGAWIGATAYIIVLSAVLYLRFLGGRWKEIKIFSAAPQQIT